MSYTRKEGLCSAQRREGSSQKRAAVINVYKYFMGGLQKRETDSSQWCPVTGQEAMGQTETHENNFFTVRLVKH